MSACTNIVCHPERSEGSAPLRKRQGLLRAVASASLLGVLALAGCRQDMHNQPKFYPQRGTDFYADGRSVRPQVANTVARSQGDVDTYFLTGMQNGAEGSGIPVPVTMALLQRGQERYNIYCTACHSRVGNGGGMIVQRGYRPAGNFHTDRLRNAPLGHFFSVITNGYGAMPDYAAQVTPADRWAIVAYIRALQLSQNAQAGDVPAGQTPQPLAKIAAAQGFTNEFAHDWALPATANVYGTPNGDDNGIPGQSKTSGGSAATPAPAALSKSATPSQQPGDKTAPTQNQLRSAAPTQSNEGTH